MSKRMEDGGRAKVLAAARSLFQEHGFHQATMAELTERSDVSVGQIYRLFRNKGEMIAAIVEEDTDTRLARLADVRDEAACGRLTARGALHRVVLDALDQGRDALIFEILAEGARNPDVGSVIAHLFDRYRAALRDIILGIHPTLEGARRDALEEALVALLFGLGNRPLLTPALAMEEMASFTVDMVMAMIFA